LCHLEWQHLSLSFPRAHDVMLSCNGTA